MLILFQEFFSDQETKVSVNLVQIGKLQELAGGDVSCTLKMTRLDLQFVYELRYKSLASQKKTYQTEVLLTNDLDFKNGIQTKLTDKVNELLYLQLEKFQSIDEKAFIESDSKVKNYITDEFNVKGLIAIFVKNINNLVKTTIKEALNVENVEINATWFNKENNMSTFQNSEFLYNNVNKLKSVTKILQEFYDQSNHPKQKSIDNLKSQILENWQKSFQDLTWKLNLFEIKILALSLSNQYLINKTNNKVLAMKLSISRETIQTHFVNVIDLIVRLFQYYQAEFNQETYSLFFVVNKDKLDVKTMKSNLFLKLIQDFKDNNSDLEKSQIKSSITQVFYNRSKKKEHFLDINYPNGNYFQFFAFQ